MVNTEKPENKSQGAGWRATIRGNVLAMGVVSLFTDFSSEMMNPLLPVYLAGLAGSGPDAMAKAALFVGLMEGIAETIAAFLKLFSGRLSDYLGKRKALTVVGYGLSSAARPTMALAAAVWQVIALKAVDRIGKGLRTSPRDALISDSVGRESRGLAFGFHRAMDHIGAVLGPVTAAVFLYAFLGKVIWKGGETSVGGREMQALRWLFTFAIVPGVAAMLFLVARVREIPPTRGAPPSDETDITPKSAWRRLPRRFYVFVGIVTLFALGNSTDMFLVLLARARFGLSLVHLIGLWVILHISKVAFSVPGGMLSDKIGRRPVMIIGWAVYAAAYVGFAAAAHSWQFVVLLLVYGFYYGMTESAEKAVVADLAPGEHRATAFGIYHSAVGLAMLPASLVFGVVWQRFGPAVSFGIGASLAGAAAVLLTVLFSTASSSTKATWRQ